MFCQVFLQTFLQVDKERGTLGTKIALPNLLYPLCFTVLSTIGIPIVQLFILPMRKLMRNYSNNRRRLIVTNINWAVISKTCGPWIEDI